MKIICRFPFQVKLTKRDKRILIAVLTLMILKPESILPIVIIASLLTSLTVGLLRLFGTLRYFFRM